MNSLIKTMAVATVALGFVSNAMATELITNGDFEAGLNGWDTYGNTASVVNIGGVHNNVANLNDDNSFGDVGIYQSFYIQPGTSDLTVSFDYYFSEDDYSLLFTDGLSSSLGQYVQLCIGLCIPFLDFHAIATTETSNGWMNFSASVDVSPFLVDTDPNARINFNLSEITGLFWDPTNSYGQIDNVSITSPDGNGGNNNGGGGANEVPEPASLALLGAGLLGLGIARRRRSI